MKNMVLNEGSMTEFLDELFNSADEADELEADQSKKEWTRAELENVRSRAREISYSEIKKGVRCIGVLFDPFHDISIFVDDDGNYYYSSYYIGD